MSKYFEIPKIEENEPTPVKKEKKDFPSSVDLFLVEFNRLFRAIENGRSNLIKGAREVYTKPLFHAMESFKEDPGEETLKHLLRISEQEGGNIVKKEMINILHNGGKKMEEYLKGIRL